MSTAHIFGRKTSSWACVQAGIAMGLAKAVAARFPSWGQDFSTLMVCGCILKQIMLSHEPSSSRIQIKLHLHGAGGQVAALASHRVAASTADRGDPVQHAVGAIAVPRRDRGAGRTPAARLPGRRQPHADQVRFWSGFLNLMIYARAVP